MNKNEIIKKINALEKELSELKAELERLEKLESLEVDPFGSVRKMLKDEHKLSDRSIDRVINEFKSRASKKLTGEIKKVQLVSYNRRTDLLSGYAENENGGLVQVYSRQAGNYAQSTHYRHYVSKRTVKDLEFSKSRLKMGFGYDYI